MSVQLAVSMFGMPGIYNDDPMGMVYGAQLAEELGFDQVVFQDHVTMGERTDRYPFGEFPLPPEAPWLEPVVLMSAVAAATSRIRLATGIVITPLRPAALLAKQMATLDQLSHGRVDLGVGVGWQREEYEAQGLDFDSRWSQFDDQLRACRKLWTEYPVSFSSRHVNMERIYSTPFPKQAELPLWFGVADTPRQARRIAELGQGWIPITYDIDKLKRGIDNIREAFVKVGRDPNELQVRAQIQAIYSQGKGGEQGADLEQSLKVADQLLAAGATCLEIVPIHFAQDPEQLRDVLTQVAALK